MSDGWRTFHLPSSEGSAVTVRLADLWPFAGLPGDYFLEDWTALARRTALAQLQNAQPPTPEFRDATDPLLHAAVKWLGSLPEDNCDRVVRLLGELLNGAPRDGKDQSDVLALATMRLAMHSSAWNVLKLLHAAREERDGKRKREFAAFGAANAEHTRQRLPNLESLACAGTMTPEQQREFAQLLKAIQPHKIGRGRPQHYAFNELVLILIDQSRKTFNIDVARAKVTMLLEKAGILPDPDAVPQEETSQKRQRVRMRAGKSARALLHEKNIKLVAQALKRKIRSRSGI